MNAQEAKAKTEAHIIGPARRSINKEISDAADRGENSILWYEYMGQPLIDSLENDGFTVKNRRILYDVSYEISW